MAHFAISDTQRRRLTYAEKINRPTLEMAGANEERLRVWNDDWRAERLGPYHHLQATMDTFAINLILVPEKGPTLHGSDGLSQKGASQSNASHYYSFTRLKTDGVLQVREAAKEVTGMSWMDHEFRSSSLEPTQVGWDWFSVQLDNRTELMLYLLRHEDGRIDNHSSGTIVHPGGQTDHLRRDMFEVIVLGAWTSPHSGTTYPQGWEIRVPKAGLRLRITPAFPDQELNTKSSTRVVYWEGRSSVEGVHNGQSVRGKGYVELVGYKARINL
jgi:predicted secreted hydrolase